MLPLIVLPLKTPAKKGSWVLESTERISNHTETTKTIRVARLHNEVCTKYFLRAMKLLTKNALNFSPKFWSLYLVGPKNPAKFPPNFPSPKSQKITNELLQKRREKKPWASSGQMQQVPENGFRRTRFGPPCDDEAEGLKKKNLDGSLLQGTYAEVM